MGIQRKRKGKGIQYKETSTPTPYQKRQSETIASTTNLPPKKQKEKQLTSNV